MISDDLDQPQCSSCRAPIWWARSVASGVAMPLDPEPRSDGNVVVDRGHSWVRVLKTGDEPGPDTPRYVSHFVTCAFAATHRKRRLA